MRRIASARRHAVPDLIQVRRLDVAGNDAAAGQTTAEGDALFVSPDNHLERMPSVDPRGVAGFDRAECGQRSKIAVEIAAVGDRVDVRAEENRLERRVAAWTAAEDVASGIDPRVEPGGAHQADDEFAPLKVRVGVGDAAHAVGERPAGGPAEPAQVLDALAKGGGVDARIERCPCFQRRCRDRSRDPRDERPPGQKQHDRRHDTSGDGRSACCQVEQARSHCITALRRGRASEGEC